MLSEVTSVERVEPTAAGKARRPRNPYFKRDIVKLVFVLGTLLGTGTLFFVSPALSTPTLLSIVVAMLFSPLVASLERRGYPRVLSITILFATLGVGIFLGSFLAIQNGLDEWSSFREAAPGYFNAATQWLREAEIAWKERYPFLSSLNPTDTITGWGEQTGTWFVTHGPALMGELLTCLFIVPILSFVMLANGREMFNRFLELVPNRFFEPILIVSTEITSSLANYIRAKLVEAVLVGVMTTAGLSLLGAPYAIVLGVLAGVTNIVPYVGPIVGAIPGIAIVAVSGYGNELLVPVIAVYGAVNLIDMAFIFPVVVAKLVNLHPLILIAVVAMGQQYYGLVGMLISIPIATALKVVIREIYFAIYSAAPRSSG